MSKQPILASDRLILRPFAIEDATVLTNLAGSKEIADTTISIPHPYRLDYAKNWIAKHSISFAEKTSVHFAIEIKETSQLIGSIELRDLDREHLQGELSLWIAKYFWGQGFATEAAKTILNYGFDRLNLNRISAYHMVRNLNSGKVLKKIGMKREGLLRQRVKKWGKFEDVLMYAIIAPDRELNS
ncbi:MAG: GNAT family N-acetyltransferase [Prochloraceae cyanobacterium]